MTAGAASGAARVRPLGPGIPGTPATARPHATGAAGGERRPALRVAETWLALGVIAVVALLVMPLPPFLLDVLLALSLALSCVVLLVTLSCRDPLEFSVFPSLLLLITLLRLGLNVSSTRLILSRGSAGQVIAAFGDFVIGGNYVVGLVIFLILVVINFVVITKGAGRVAEVAARFTLDAMPGRQMSIDADLGAGIIDETEARERREELSRYADFYGAMDGAAKFVRGDAVAGLLITAINLVGGFVIGMTQHGLGALESLSTFASLTVGDGLVTQIPALIVSTSAGILVTYGSAGHEMAPALASQLGRAPRALWTSSVLLALFAVVPGLPATPFLLLAGGAAAAGWAAGRRPENDQASLPPAAAEPATATPVIRDLLSVDPLELEIGYGLLPLADEQHGGDLLQRIGILRKQLAYEIGVVIPPVRVRDNIQLGATEYAVRLRGARIASGELLPQLRLAIDADGDAGTVDGLPTRDPCFGLRAVWITPERRTEAEAAGFSVVDPPTVLTTHLMELVREHAADLLTRQHTRELLDGLKETQSALVDDLVPGRIPLGSVHRVLQRLLREGLPVRDLGSILEALADAADQTKDPEALTEHARRALAPAMVQALAGADGVVRVIGVGPRLETALMHLFAPRAREGRTLDADELAAALAAIARLSETHRRDGRLLPLLAPPALRTGIRRLLEPVLPRLPVISLAELPTRALVETTTSWELPDAR